jgi:homoserine kinase type II
MAVYTRVAADDLGRFLENYEIGPALELAGIRQGVENTNYRLVTPAGRFIVTIYEKRVDPGDLPFFLGLMEHLARHGLPCPLPVASRDGTVLRTLCGKPAAIVTFLEGQAVDRPTARHCEKLGEALASMHLAGLSYGMRRPNALGPDGWHSLLRACARRADEIAPNLTQELTEELAGLARSWPSHLPAGVIHADLFPDNVFFDGSRVSGLIDFYFACNDLLAYDIAVCMNAWCFDADHAFEITRARALLSGYRRVRPLGPEEISALPLLCRGSALRFLLTRLYDWLNRVNGALVQPKDPLEYRRKLRFHRLVTDVSAYGIT